MTLKKLPKTHFENLKLTKIINRTKITIINGELGIIVRGKTMKKLSGIFLAVLTFFSSTLNVFADTIEVFEEKTETINKEDYEAIHKTMR